MKQLVLLSISAAISSLASAQSVVRTNEFIYSAAPAKHLAAKTTGVYHDTILMQNITSADTNTLYLATANSDSGYIFGTSGYGFSGFAERYDFNSADSNVQVYGTLSLFSGTVNPASTKNVTFKVWSVGSQAPTSSSRVFFSGFPSTVLDSVSVSMRNLGIGGAAAADTFKIHYFPTATSTLTSSFFVGYTTNYSFAALGGDTIGLQSTRIGGRNSALYTVSGPDTIITNQNATLNGANWLDNGTQLGVSVNLYIFPIVKVYNFLSVNGLTNKNITFFGNYPNPAVNETNVRFSIAESSDVTIDVMDINGRTVKSISAANLNVGEHTVAVDLTSLPSGEYLYLVRSNKGGGVASKFTIAK
ncbi:MAG: T9SS type A sorting domain-containing protein [Taibaiella sp.]|nr:T9SS type A sorting domain-containing protein [Taibaiella sp.]